MKIRFTGFAPLLGIILLASAALADHPDEGPSPEVKTATEAARLH